MERARPQAASGFTLIEALISLTLFLIILLGVTSVFITGNRLYARAERKADAQDNARLAMSEISRQLRLAGYFPENFTSPPASPLLTTGIRVGTDQTIAFYGDADGTGASEVIVYCLDGPRLRRNTGLDTAAATYTCNNGEVLAENVTSLRFTYYATDGSPVPSPPTTPYTLDSQSLGSVPSMTTTTQRGSIRRVVVTLTARRVVAGGGRQDYTLTSNVWLRNS